MSVAEEIVELLEEVYCLPDLPNEVPNCAVLASSVTAVIDSPMTCGGELKPTLPWVWAWLLYEAFDAAAPMVETIRILGSALLVWELIWKPGGGVRASIQPLLNFNSWI